MPKAVFIGTWCPEFQENVPRGRLVLEPEEIYRKNIGEEIKRIKEYQLAKGERRKLKITLEYHFKKRTLDQNSLYWGLLSIQANEMNGGMKGKDMVTPEQLHKAYLLEYGEREEIRTSRKNLGRWKSDKYIEFILINGKKLTYEDFIREYPDILPEQTITLQVIRGTSEMTTKEMAGVIDTVFNDLSISGVAVTNPGDLHNYWVTWREHLNDEKIILHDEVMTRKQYKDANPICEGCGINPGEELAHIQAVGMGGKEESEKNYASNWLHLCNDCHREIWHRHGVKEFLRIFKHLTYKVTTATKRDYGEIAPEPIEDAPQGTLFDEVKDDNVKTCPECMATHTGEHCPECGDIGIF